MNLIKATTNKMKDFIEELRKVMEGHKMTDIQKSAVEWVFKQALDSQKAKIVEMVEGKKVKVIYCVDRLECEDEHCLSCDSGMSNCDFAEQNKSYNQAINDILTLLK